MLELKGICKRYVTQSFTQVALDSVSLSFRDNEFVAILGPSGSGKTTMLNVIGGLDHFDSGDLLIDGISTKDFHDRDWDAYRNNRIGFVFQSYNLIPHQTILENVELALTLTGVGHAERRQRAREALEKVGLGEHVNKRPSQLSGGQMQRVAIARALINDPEIVLADEPTGALDSTTSVQVMDLLKDVARDRLVIMVTHNPELAYQYATRIVNLVDGKIGALKFARETKLPALGLCLGLQSMVIEYSRHVLGIEDANSSEFEPDCANPVIATMEEQKDIVAGKGDMGHTMRLGSYPAELEEGSLVAELYGTTHVTERHRHRYEVNVAYKDRLREGGLVISGQSPDGELTEFVELPREVHPFYVATQAHPEFKSRPTKPHPLFAGLVKAALDHQQAR